MKLLMEQWKQFVEAAETEKQKRFMHAVEDCKEDGDCPSDDIEKAADSMTTKQVKDYTTKPVKEELDSHEDKTGDEVASAHQSELDAATKLSKIEEIVHELLEADDRCTRIAKRKYDVWPSAYASGAVVKCRDGKIWKDLKEEEVEEDLKKWFARKGEKGSTGGWVDCNAPDGDGGYKQCAQGDRKKKPACRPTPSACKDPGKGTKWGKKDEIVQLTEEHIEEIVNNIMTQIEEGGQCTGPTQKASSTSKGKKWMQCVKNPDGKGYKRIHWGQKGVRVTGDSGNTKRKKSFRARHGCKDAKAGTAKYMACKDW